MLKETQVLYTEFRFTISGHSALEVHISTKLVLPWELENVFNLVRKVS